MERTIYRRGFIFTLTIIETSCNKLVSLKKESNTWGGNFLQFYGNKLKYIFVVSTAIQ